jgi:glycosyltransferase involved in cell wall biosynthesis
LIASLRDQTDQDFEWVVADGGSSDNTLSILESAHGLRATVLSNPDFGIYDALNRAIRHASGKYYLVLGADDRLFAGAIEHFREAALSSDADFVTAEVVAGNKVLKVRAGRERRFGINGLISAHSVGTLIRKSLHERFGYYSRKFPIAADQLFVMQACAAGATRKVCDFRAGEFGGAGVSSEDVVGMSTEFYRVQLLLGANEWSQLALLLGRLLKYRLGSFWK